jgi:hypothetical protein
MPPRTQPSPAEQASFVMSADPTPAPAGGAKAAKGVDKLAKEQAAADKKAAKEQAAADKAAAKAAKDALAAQKASSKKAGKVPTILQALTGFLEGPLLADLTARAKAPAVDRALRQQWERERAAGRSAEHFEGFRERTALQIGASWLLGCVFVRTLEDRDLLERRRLAGEGADDSERLFFEQFPSLGHRDYLLAVFREVGKLAGAASVLGPGAAPAYRLGPSSEVARDLLKLFRRADDLSGALLYRFDGEDTRLLGDIYQDLSADIRERYALLQTPVFVEEFILSRTLTPALATFGLDDLRLLDPTCGSGHFLLGAFAQLVDQWRSLHPNLAPAEQARRALAQVNGVDLNPYAIAIARFRLTLAFLKAGGLRRLRDVVEPLPLNLVVADSLLIAARKETRRFSEVSPEASWGDSLFSLEDPVAAYKLLGQGYHAVVGNPPYITCKDAALRDKYRELYDSAHRLFALAAPFTERFFQLGIPGGFVGLINANSFMKREFGKPLVETVLPQIDLTHVIDTAGAFIPGHGTPTVILFGRNQRPATSVVRAILGKRGEPSTPDEPAKGLVWLSISKQVDHLEFENDFVSVADVERTTFAKHPWSLGGGGAAELKELLEERAEKRLGGILSSLGRSTHTGEDEVFFMPAGAVARLGIPTEKMVLLVKGEQVRDWAIVEDEACLFPYERSNATAEAPKGREAQHYWVFRRTLKERKDYGQHIEERGLKWFEHSMFFPERFRTPLSISFPFVATHNHFVLDRGGKVFNRTAPIIKLPVGATEEDHLALLGYLNSSTACFWMKQVIHNKSSASQKHHSDPARAAYEFSGTALEPLPIPKLSPELSSRLVRLSAKLLEVGTVRSSWSSGSTLATAIGEGFASRQQLADALASGWRSFDEATSRGVFLQEEIDWLIYAAFALCSAKDAQLTAPEDGAVSLGGRPFEHVEGYVAGISDRARKSESVGVAARPKHWDARIDLLATDGIQLLESRAFKRQWRDTEQNIDQSEFRVRAQKEWLIRYVAESAEAVLKEKTLPVSTSSLLGELLGGPGRDTLQAIADLLVLDVWELFDLAVLPEIVPHLAALRHTEAGMEKRRVWEETWRLQRREDAGEKLDVPVPPKYDSKDYRKADYWSLRGKLDVPKERFISYPGAETVEGGVVLGWAGWDHLQRATALAGLYQERKDEQGWEGERLVPLLAGLWELVPWLKQWHNEHNEAYGGERLGDYFASFVAEEARLWGQTTKKLEEWRPGGR